MIETSVSSNQCLAGSNKSRHHSVARELVNCTQAEGRPITFSVAGDCMNPVLQNGDSITVHRTERYLPGDIVVYSDAVRGQVAHRLLGSLRIKGQQKYLITPDHAERPDPLIEASRMLGKVRLVNQSPVAISIFQRASSCISFAFWAIHIGLTKRVIPHLLRNLEKT